MRRLYMAADPDEWDLASVRSLLTSARRRGIGLYAVPPGRLQDAWARTFPRRGRCEHAVYLRWLDPVRLAGFTGVQLDVEPHAARGPWRPWGRRRVWETGADARDGNVRLAHEYLDLLDALRAHLAATGAPLRFAVTIPHWYDATGGLVFERSGRTQALAHHVQDRADFVTIMAYVDGSGADGPAAVLRALEDEAARGPVEALFETAPAGRRQGRPLPEETLHEEGETRFEALCGDVERRFRDGGHLVGCAVHAWKHAYGSGAPGWPSAP